MPSTRRAGRILAAGLLAAALTGSPASAYDPRLLEPGAIVGSCWAEARTFDSLKSGPVPYCRGHLRYTPGRLDCYWISEQVCWVYLPGRNDWVLTRTPEERLAFPCPYAAEPPVCPRLAGL
ncbi:MAG: hypothetical protein U0807_00810 [Candidatus Binatia bacterium]